MPINLPTTKLFIFINRLFTNNKDFNFQLRYKIIIINKFIKENDFIIYGNETEVEPIDLYLEKLHLY